MAITLIESSGIPTVGVGEATLPGMRSLSRRTGIDEAGFLTACDGSERPPATADRGAYATSPHQQRG